MLALLTLLLLLPMLMLLSLLLLSLLLSLLLLLLLLLLEPKFPARDTEAARKLRKVNVEIAPEESHRGSDSTSLYTWYFLPEKLVSIRLVLSPSSRRGSMKTKSGHPASNGALSWRNSEVNEK